MDSTSLDEIGLALGWILLAALVFVAAGLALVMIPLMRWNKAAHALVVRNFVGYFSNPTGYVFLTLFVFMTSIATFVPDDFFNNNLASLSELNSRMPWVLLLFIPAITMSIWAEEAQQGTDELLLTLPTTDFDIVLGKYLAAAAIYTTSLLFAMITTFVVMDVLSLGELDIGLFLASFFGYWWMGLAMLAIGMVASFFTSNLTVAFIFGALLNLPFVIASGDLMIPAAKMSADMLGLSPEFPVNFARGLSRWSYSDQFQGFAQGSISFSAIIFFFSVVVIGLYLSVVLIARRHWLSGPKSTELMGHFAVRTLSLVAIAFALNYFFSYRDFRLDATSKQVASLSSDARELVRGIDSKRPVLIEAFIGNKTPTPWLKTRYDLIAALQDFSSTSGGQVQVRIYDNLELSGDEALRAEKQFNIKPETIQWSDKGVLRTDEVLLGVAISSGQKRMTIPFLSSGIPVEYELSRVIASLTDAKKKRLGVLRTDAALISTMDPRQTQLIVQELRQQYEIVDVDPTGPISASDIDVLLAVQPSSLSPPAMENFIAAVESGIPTAIFEDPLPNYYRNQNVPGTDQPKMPRGQMAMFQQPQEKGDIRKLFKRLGIDLVSSSTAAGGALGPSSQAAIIWQSYNPYPQTSQTGEFLDEWIFVSPETKPAIENAKDPFNQQVAAVRDFSELLMPLPGAIVNEGKEGIKFTELLTTGVNAGRISITDLSTASSAGQIREKQGKPDGKQYILAALIEGKEPIGAKPDEKKADEKAAKKDEDKAEPRKLRVTVVADIDLMHSIFVQMRQRPDPNGQIDFRFQNVPFVLNVLDLVAGDDRYLRMRQRESTYVKLKLVEQTMQEIWTQANKTITEFIQKRNDKVKAAQEEMNTAVLKLQKELDEQKNISPRELQRKLQELMTTKVGLEKKVHEEQAESEAELKKNMERISRQSDASLISIRNSFKMWAVLLPLIPPALVALAMWIRSRLREGESVPRSRNIYTMRSEPAPAGKG